MKKVKIKIDLDKITKKVIKEHQMLKGELKRIEKLNEGIEYDPNHPERMNPNLEDKLRSGEHTLVEIRVYLRQVLIKTFQKN